MNKIIKELNISGCETRRIIKPRKKKDKQDVENIQLSMDMEVSLKTKQSR
ncbi:hypothetical protein [Bacillus sp. REN10]|nr:hypothetical protein [Bacillus sp. REN10]